MYLPSSGTCFTLDLTVDPSMWEWKEIAPLPEDVVAGNVFIVEGGSTAYLIRDTVLKYDFHTNQWRSVPSLTTPILVGASFKQENYF